MIQGVRYSFPVNRSHGVLFHIVGVIHNLQLLSRTRAAEQDRELFLFWRWRRFCAVKLRPIGQPPDSGHQCAYRPGKQRGAILFFFFVALQSGRSGFLVGGRVGRVGHERGIPQSLLGCREFSFKALRLGFPGGGAGTPRGSLILVFQFRRPAGCRRRLGRHPQNRLRRWFRRLLRWSHIVVSRVHLLPYVLDTGVQIGSSLTWSAPR